MKKMSFSLRFVIVAALLCLFASVSVWSRDDKPIVTVLDFSVSQVSEQEAGILVDYFSGHLVKSGRYRVIDRTQRQNILGELQFSYDGCTDEKCQLEIGKLLAARYIFIGSLGKLGSRYILNMSLVEVETGETLNSFSDKYNNLDALVDDTARIINIFTGAPAEPVSTASAASSESSGSDRKTEKDSSAATTPAGTAPASVKPATSAKPAAPSLKGYFDFGMVFGGPTESDIITEPLYGAYIGGVLPIVEFFYLSGTINLLLESLDNDARAAFLFGAEAILGNPADMAIGLGVIAGNNSDVYGPPAMFGGTIYVGGFSFRLFYGEADYESYSGPFVGVGFGFQF